MKAIVIGSGVISAAHIEPYQEKVLRLLQSSIRIKHLVKQQWSVMVFRMV